MGGLLAPPALVVVEIGVELRQRHDGHAALHDGRMEHALVVRRHEMHVALPLPRSEPERPRDRGRVALQIAVDRGQAQERIAIASEGDAVTFNVNARYVLDFLDSIDSTAVACRIHDAVTPIVIVPADPDSPDCLGLIVPKRDVKDAAA